jgi:hypothetical protein
MGPEVCTASRVDLDAFTDSNGTVHHDEIRKMVLVAPKFVGLSLKARK